MLDSRNVGNGAQYEIVLRTVALVLRIPDLETRAVAICTESDRGLKSIRLHLFVTAVARAVEALSLCLPPLSVDAALEVCRLVYDSRSGPRRPLQSATTTRSGIRRRVS